MFAHGVEDRENKNAGAILRVGTGLGDFLFVRRPQRQTFLTMAIVQRLVAAHLFVLLRAHNLLEHPI